MDPRAPVIVGVGQFLNRVDQGADGLSPTDLILEAASRAEADAGADLAHARRGGGGGADDLLALQRSGPHRRRCARRDRGQDVVPGDGREHTSDDAQPSGDADIRRGPRNRPALRRRVVEHPHEPQARRRATGLARPGCERGPRLGTRGHVQPRSSRGARSGDRRSRADLPAVRDRSHACRPLRASGTNGPPAHRPRR